MALVIGSLAAHIHHPEIWTDYLDVDLVMCQDEFLDQWAQVGRWVPTSPTTWVGQLQNRVVEVTTAQPGDGSTDAELLDIYSGGGGGITTRFGGHDLCVAEMPHLYTLKISHRYLAGPHFEKTRRDIRAMEELGYRQYHPDSWLNRREAETYKRRHPRLDVSKRDFFSDAHGVEYRYDHDSIHRAMAHGDRPAYQEYQVPGAEVQCSRRLWDACTQETRLLGVLEECYVLALERSQIPHPGASSPRDSFRRALRAVCTTVTSGWFREFAYEHYYNVLRLYRDDYVQRFQAALERGTVLPAT